MSATKNECNRGSPSIYRPEANAWISKRSSDLDYKGVFALIKIGFLQSSFYEVMWSSLVTRLLHMTPYRSGMKATAELPSRAKKAEPDIVFSLICSNKFKILISFNFILSYM